MADDGQPTSIWKKEISFRRKPGEASAEPVAGETAEASAADWHARPGADGSDNPDWQLYAVRAREIEFWQARHDREHIRHRYGSDELG